MRIHAIACANAPIEGLRECLKFLFQRSPFAASNNVDFNNRIIEILREPLVVNLSSLFRTFPKLPACRPDGFDLAGKVFKHYLVTSVKVHIQFLGARFHHDYSTIPLVSFRDSKGHPVKGTAHITNRSSTKDSLDFTVHIQEIESPDLSPVPRDSIHPYQIPTDIRFVYDPDTMSRPVWERVHALWPNYNVQLPPSPPLFHASDYNYDGTFISSPRVSPQMIIHPAPGSEFPAKIFCSVTSRTVLSERDFSLPRP
jgi:hypothetical protein